MRTLKTCPHCGGSANLVSVFSNRKQCFFIYVKCGICGAQGKAFTSKEDLVLKDPESDLCQSAVNAWNMRTEERTELNAV